LKIRNNFVANFIGVLEHSEGDVDIVVMSTWRRNLKRLGLFEKHVMTEIRKSQKLRSRVNWSWTQVTPDSNYHPPKEQVPEDLRDWQEQLKQSEHLKTQEHDRVLVPIVDPACPCKRDM